jgi:AcrR family transcriptional regulator
VIDVALLGIIRRWHIRDQIPLREIARRLGISRNTVRRYLRSEAIEPAYAERRSSRTIDKYAFQLSALLKTEAAKSRKQRRTLKRIHEDLKELGFEGSYDRGAAFARVWREGQTERVNRASKRTALATLSTTDTQRAPHSATFDKFPNRHPGAQGKEQEKPELFVKRIDAHA